MNGKGDFEQFVRHELDETVDQMDAVTRSRLAAMRRQATASNQTRSGWRLPLSMAMAMTALALVWMLPQQQTGNDVVELDKTFAAIEDLDLLASDIDLDLLENVEFYQWQSDDEY